MSTPTKRIISLYTEATPNPSTMKFVVNTMLFARDRIDMPTKEAADQFSPLAQALYENFVWVNGIFIANNFVTITKGAKHSSEWYEVIPEVREFIRSYLTDEKAILHEEAIAEFKKTEIKEEKIQTSADDSEIVVKIKDLLQKYVQPAVEMDGGSIVFRSYENGILTLGMQGACSGCPSSSVTLKSGIENLMKRMVPEVQEVVAEAV